MAKTQDLRSLKSLVNKREGQKFQSLQGLQGVLSLDMKISIQLLGRISLYFILGENCIVIKLHAKTTD